MQKNTEISERLLYVIEEKGVKPNKYAQSLGYKRAQTLYDALNKGIFGLDLLKRIAESSVDVNWLLTGKKSEGGDIQIIQDQYKTYGNCPECEKKQRHIDMLFNQLEDKERQIQEYIKKCEDCENNQGKSKQNYG